MAEAPDHAPPQHSPDGRWWWDGQRWIAVSQQPPGSPVTGRVDWLLAKGPPRQEQRRAPIQLGGAADRRFEHRFVIFRRVARYLLLADLLAFVFLSTFSGLDHSLGATARLVLILLGDSFLILVIPSLLSIATARVVREATISASPESVFALLVDPEAWVRRGGTWAGRYRSIDSVAQAASGGTKGRATLTALGFRGEMQWEMLEYRPPNRVVIFGRTKLLGIPTLNLAIWSLEQKEGQTHIRIEQEHRALGLIGLSGAAVSRVLGRGIDRQLADLPGEVDKSR